MHSHQRAPARAPPWRASTCADAAPRPPASPGTPPAPITRHVLVCHHHYVYKLSRAAWGYHSVDQARVSGGEPVTRAGKVVHAGGAQHKRHVELGLRARRRKQLGHEACQLQQPRHSRRVRVGSVRETRRCRCIRVRITSGRRARKLVCKHSPAAKAS